MASPSAVCTVELAVLSPKGVVTGWDSWNGWLNGEGLAPAAKFQNSANRTAPRWSESAFPFQWARVVQASPSLTLPPLDVGAVPPEAWNLVQSFTRPDSVSWAAQESSERSSLRISAAVNPGGPC